jgi:hypothetical protein
MAVTAAHQHDDRVSLLAMVQRSLYLGAASAGCPNSIRAEIVESPSNATAEAYVTRISTVGDEACVQLMLDFGLPATATLPAFEAEWLGLAEDEIITVRLDRWKNIR